MPSLAKTLMDIYYTEERKWLKQMDATDGDVIYLEIAQAYSDGESMVNNLMHGRPDSDWVPQFVKIMRDRAAESSVVIAEHFEIIAEIAEASL